MLKLPNEGVGKVPEKLNGANMAVRSPFQRGGLWRVRDSEGSNFAYKFGKFQNGVFLQLQSLTRAAGQRARSGLWNVRSMEGLGSCVSSAPPIAFIGEMSAKTRGSAEDEH